MHIPLRIGNGDARFLKTAPDRQIDIRTDIADAFLRIGEPDTQLQCNTTVGKLHQAHRRFRISEYPAVDAGRLFHNRHRLLRIIVITDLYRDTHAHGLSL